MLNLRSMEKRDKILQFIEFLIIGVLVGLIEDLLAIFFATDAKITWQVVWIVLLIAIPFAAFSELIVDHPRFWECVLRKHKNQEPSNSGQ